MATIITIAMQKGGTGKTTTAVNIAAGLANAGHPTLLVDLDSQGSTGRFLGVKSERGTADVLADMLPVSRAAVEARPGLDLLTGDYRLAGVGNGLAGQEYVLEDKLGTVASRYEYIILDPSPAWNFSLIAALLAASFVISPLTLQIASLNAYRDFVANIGRIRGADIDLRYILPVIVDRRLAQTGEIMEALPDLGPEILPGIPISARLQECNGFGETIFEYAPNDRAAAAYQNAIEVLRNGT